MLRGPNPSYLLLLVVLIGGMVGYPYATSAAVDVVVREKRLEQGESRRGLPVVVHVPLPDRGPLPMSGLPLVGYRDPAEVYAGIRPGRRYPMRLASWPWRRDRMVTEICPQAQAN